MRTIILYLYNVYYCSQHLVTNMVMYDRDCHSSTQLFNPKRLKTLAFNVRNTLLHHLVLDNSDPYNSGHENNIKAVLRCMSDVPVNALNNEGYSALHLAVLRNNLFMVRKLLSCLPNIDVNTRCDAGSDQNTALHLAVKKGYLSIVEELLHKVDDVDIKNKCGNTPLSFASMLADLDIIKLLVRRGANVNLKGYYGFPIHCVAMSGNLEAVKFLKGSGADLSVTNRNDESILHDAIRSSSLPVVEFLVTNGVEINAENDLRPPLWTAAVSGNIDIIKFFINRGVNLMSESGFYLILYAARLCDSEFLQYLISKGADINLKDKKGRPPLHSLILKSNNLAPVEFLIKHGCDVNGRDKYNETPLHYSVHFNCLRTVKLLVNSGANINAEDGNNKTPLHYGLCQSDLEIVKFLVKNGADINTKDKDNRTPLHYAMYNENLEIVAFLLDQGADFRATDKYGKTPLHYAMEKWYKNKFKFIRIVDYEMS